MCHTRWSRVQNPRKLHVRYPHTQYWYFEAGSTKLKVLDSICIDSGLSLFTEIIQFLGYTSRILDQVNIQYSWPNDKYTKIILCLDWCTMCVQSILQKGFCWSITYTPETFELYIIFSMVIRGFSQCEGTWLAEFK